MQKRKRNQWGFSPGPLIRVICCNPLKAGTVVVYFALFSTWNRVNHPSPGRNFSRLPAYTRLSDWLFRIRARPSGLQADKCCHSTGSSMQFTDAAIHGTRLCTLPQPRTALFRILFAPVSRSQQGRREKGEPLKKFTRSRRNESRYALCFQILSRYEGFLSRWRAIRAVSMQLWFLLWENGMNPIQRRIVRLSENGHIRVC